MELASSGIEALGDIKWGSHFCHFYHGHEDLIDTLVPYFKAGLESNEQCLWITSEPLLANEARTLLKKAVPHLDKLEKSGQIEIYNYNDWYLKTGKTDAESTLQSWVDRQSHALARGRKGLRLTGNTYWLERKDWKGFIDYEGKVNQTFSKHRIIGLCSYCLNKTISTDVFDVVRNHDFALLRQAGEWELLETAKTKKSKDQLQKLNSDLKENLIKAKDSAESANRLKTAFLTNMSHEIRTPLSAILGFSDLLKDPDTHPAEKDTFIDTIQRNGQFLSRLIDDILDLSKIEADRLGIEKTEFSIPEFVNDVMAMFSPNAEAKSLMLRMEQVGILPEKISSDPIRMRQILINLIGNAVKFTDKGSVTIQLQSVSSPEQDPQLQVRVIDTGIGMSKEHQAALFQLFSQGDTSLTRRYGGSGIGLYLSKRLAEVLGGNIELERSSPGEGSTFLATFSI